MQEFGCGQVRVSGCKNDYKFVLVAGAKPKNHDRFINASVSVIGC